MALVRSKAIDTSVPSNTVDFGVLPSLIGYQLRMAQVAMFRDFKNTVDGTDITPGLFGVLVLVEANPGLKQTELARAVHLDRSTVVNVVDNLEATKLVERRAVDGDRRAKALFLTGRGRMLLQKLKRQVLAHEKRLARNLTSAERGKLAELLQRIFPEHR